MGGGPWDSLASQGPVVTVLLGLVWALITGRLITGREFEEMKRDRTLWRAIADPAIRAAERATTMAEGRTRGGDDVG